jgi:hypothetical protein
MQLLSCFHSKMVEDERDKKTSSSDECLAEKASSVVGVPVGIQVLLSKASVDSDFRTALLRDRIAAANSIGLELSDVEKATLSSIPEDQLEAMIQNTRVPNALRSTFMGCATAAMIAALGFLAVKYLGVKVSKQFGATAHSISN